MAQVLFDRAFGQIQLPSYLGVAFASLYQLKDLPFSGVEVFVVQVNHNEPSIMRTLSKAKLHIILSMWASPFSVFVLVSFTRCQRQYVL